MGNQGWLFGTCIGSFEKLLLLRVTLRVTEANKENLNRRPFLNRRQQRKQRGIRVGLLGPAWAIRETPASTRHVAGDRSEQRVFEQKVAREAKGESGLAFWDVHRVIRQTPASTCHVVGDRSEQRVFEQKAAKEAKGNQGWAFGTCMGHSTNSCFYASRCG